LGSCNPATPPPFRCAPGGEYHNVYLSQMTVIDLGKEGRVNQSAYEIYKRSDGHS